jgi:hypothetical protein
VAAGVGGPVDVVVVVAELEAGVEYAEEVLVTVVAVVILLAVTLPVEYMLSLLGPPQYSV